MNCAHCRQEISGRKRKYCAPICRNAANRNSRSAICENSECDRPVRARDMCSMHYRRWERANGKACPPSDQWGPRRKANWKKRHAIKRGAEESETIYEMSIFERDNWTCRLCNEPVDRRLQWPNQMCASLDHKRPLAKGGTHTRSNVQLAHFKCNAMKGARVTDQLVTIGGTPT